MSSYNTDNTLVAYAGMREKIAQLGVTEAFNLARVCSYGGVELLFIAHECATICEMAEEYREAIAHSGIGVKCISCYVDLLTNDGSYRVSHAATEAVKRCVDLAQAIGCPLVHHTLVTRLSGGRDGYAEALPHAVRAAEEIATYAYGRGITVLYEPQGMLFNGLDGYSGLLDAMLCRHENVGLCLDIGNTLWVDEDCYALAQKYAHLIRHVHLKDYRLDTEDTRYRTAGGHTIEEVLLGTGIINLSQVLDILARAGYRGALAIEDNSNSDFNSIALNALTVVAKAKCPSGVTNRASAR